MQNVHSLNQDDVLSGDPKEDELSPSAFGDEEDAIGQTLQLTPSVEAATQSASRVAAPVLRDAAALLREVRPGVRQLPATVNALHRVAVNGIPVLRRAPVLGMQLQSTLRTVDGTLQRRSFGDSLTLLTPTVNQLTPAEPLERLPFWERPVTEFEKAGRVFTASATFTGFNALSSSAPITETGVGAS